MNLGNFLQAIISIALIYLILALLTSELQELIATCFEVRSKRLKQSIYRMLGEESWNGQTFIDDIEIKNIESAEVIKAGKYVYCLNKNIKEILDNKNIIETSEKKYVWVDVKNKKDIKFDSIDENTAQSEDGLLRKIQAYKVQLDLKKDEYYLCAGENIIKAELGSMTEKFYDHPNIIALNQSAFAWLSVLGIYFSYPRKLKDWKLKDRLSLYLTILLIFLIACTLKKMIETQIIIFFVFVFVRVLSYLLVKRTNYRNSCGPSYIEDSGQFADTLIDVIRISQKKGSEDKEIKIENIDFYTPAKSVLRNLIGLSISIDPTSITSARNSLIAQYDEVNKRSEGVYKRNAKGLSFAIGFLVAVLLNADTLHMVTSLTKENADFSKQVITALENLEFTKCDSSVQGDCQAKQERLKELISNAGTLPLGWNYDEKLGKAEKSTDIVIRNEALAKNKIDIDKNFKLIQKLDGDKHSNLKTCNDDLKSKECYEAIETVFLDGKNADLFPDLSEELKLSFKSVEGAKIEEKSNQIKLFQSVFKKFIRDSRGQLVSLLIDSKKEEVPLIEPGITLINTLDTNQINNTVNKHGGWFSAILGWLITAVAIGMGAPFWFDLLGRVMNVRNAGNYRQRPK